MAESLDENSLDFVLRKYYRRNDSEAEESILVVLRLAQNLLGSGDLVRALAEFRRASEFARYDPVAYSTCQKGIKDAERLIELDKKLPAVLRGDTPGDADELVGFAKLCRLKQLHVESARLWMSAFAADPSLAADLEAGHARHAAYAAALAGCGLGKDAGSLDLEQRSEWRKQALAWLRIQLDRWKEELRRRRPRAMRSLLKALGQWRHDQDLACLRGEAALAKIPEAERTEWRAFWSDVEALRAEVRK